jgi:hypothetical protein
MHGLVIKRSGTTMSLARVEWDVQHEYHGRRQRAVVKEFVANQVHNELLSTRIAQA